MPITGRIVTEAGPPTGWQASSGYPGSKEEFMHKLLAVVFALMSAAAAAQTFPSKPVRFVSGVTPGSASDTMARLLAEKLQHKWNQSVIVENRLGAGGLVGAKYVSQTEPDGHTIMM